MWADHRGTAPRQPTRCHPDRHTRALNARPNYLRKQHGTGSTSPESFSMMRCSGSPPPHNRE
eukprot:10569244-Lingulodinium_polyedra.AAC.1